ncbi:hypothetical protein ACA910_012647 [Epithemia clementina (nom. ined.)]
MKPHTSSVKPTLTEENKVARIMYCLEIRHPIDINRYQDMMNIIHVDEKWFFLTRVKEQFYLADDEDLPTRSVKHKSHITKVQFLCAVARPRFDNTTISWFDGKLGIWPIGDWVPAAMSSANRPRGTLVWKNKNVNHEVYRYLLIKKLIPAILEKWPAAQRTNTIRIQQDGAKSHIKENDEEFKIALSESGLNACLFTQPANSPDLNLCDLGFFRAIQSANDEAMTCENDLIQAVQRAYQEYPKELLNKTWLTLQSVMNSILEAHGNNNYTIIHMNKNGLEKKDLLPTVLNVTEHAQVFTEDFSPTDDDDDDDDHLEYDEFDEFSFGNFSFFSDT